MESSRLGVGEVGGNLRVLLFFSWFGALDGGFWWFLLLWMVVLSCLDGGSRWFG